MPTVVVDTDVVSFLMKRDSRAAAYTPLLQGNRLAVSFMTVAELYQWAAIRKWGVQRRTRLEQALARYLVVPADIDACRLWGSLRAKRQSAGRPIAPQDAWIAGTALRHNVPLITHNIGDCSNISGLDVQSIQP